MNLVIIINGVWNVCTWYIIVESTLSNYRPHYAASISAIGYESAEKGCSAFCRQLKQGYNIGFRQYGPQTSGILRNRTNERFSNFKFSHRVKCVDEDHDWIPEDVIVDDGSPTDSISDIEQTGNDDNDVVDEGIDDEANDGVDFQKMLRNKELAEVPTEKKIKIPYIVEYPTDRVSEEQDMTKEDVARSIMTELGFFYPGAHGSGFRYYGETATTIKTSDSHLSINSPMDGRGSTTTTSEAGDATGYRSDMALVGAGVSSFKSSGTNEVGVNSNSSIGSRGLTFSQAGTTDNTVDEEQEDPKSYLVKTTLVAKLDKKEEDAPASILDEPESPVVGHQRVRWFPNYVSRSLRRLHDYLKSSDLILDVRDGRLPFIPFNDYFFNIFESEFPMKPRITVFTHSDLLPRVGMTDWLNYYRRINKLIAKNYNANITDPSQRRVENRTMFVDARNGLKEIIYLRKHIYRMTRRVRERCVKRGMRPRGIRVIVLGMPNVGKSSLINRLLGRRAARATGSPGTTRDISLYNESVSRNERSSWDDSRQSTKSDTITEKGNDETSGEQSVRGFKRLVLIDTPGIITPLKELSRPLFNLLTRNGANSGLKTFSTSDSRGYGNKGLVKSVTKMGGSRNGPSGSAIVSYGGANTSDRETMMLIYSGLNIIGESACEEDEVLIVILKEMLKMLMIRPKYVEAPKIRRKYPLLATMINRFVSGGARRSWLDVESEISYNLERISTWLFGGNLSSCCSKMLNDFRRGKLGHVMLQAPPYVPFHSARSSSIGGDVSSTSYTSTSTSGSQVSTSSKISGQELMKNEHGGCNTKDKNSSLDGDAITLEYSMGAYEGW